MKPNAMPSSLFQMRRHTRRPPPTCKSSWREGRIATFRHSPATLTGYVRWLDLGASPPIDSSALIDAAAQPTFNSFFGTTLVLDVTLTLGIYPQPGPTLYDVVLTCFRGAYVDSHSWLGLTIPLDTCLWDTGELSHVHYPDYEEHDARLSV